MPNNILYSEYSHLSLKDIKLELNKRLSILDEKIKKSDISIEKLDEYWKTLGYDDFVSSALRCKKLLNTAKEDIDYILSEFDEEIKENHITILCRIGHTSMEFNRELGVSKGQGGRRLVDGVEYNLYCSLRDSMLYLTDLSGIANRLKDFVGKKKRHIHWGIIISNIFALGALIVSILSYLKD